jgi:hypothetical protein
MMSLLNAGVPLKVPVGGFALCLISGEVGVKHDYVIFV